VNAEDLRSLGLVVAGSRQDLADVVFLQLPEADQEVSTGISVSRMDFGVDLIPRFSDFLRQRYGIDVSFRGEDHSALDHIFQLPDVPGPGIVHDQISGFGHESEEALLQLFVEALHHVEGQRKNVFLPFAQRRDE